ncbi:hypothetical protein [Amycolatopsis dendrobii]|uniref:Uncharacterized protein n=1 Tax=Amycolatopsis dendrobii TaxID=2760662 RepID=A0A7W3VUY5_9PSEU|nr:hypothetical protein [Amycolatopsis dendrobii]MBB1153484.1 hypothetical protein [Amycolatopsis dendrobii]
MEIKHPDKHYPELTLREVEDCASEVRWRVRMLRESRRQALLLEQLVSAVGGNGEKLEQVREHLAHWDVQ